MPKKSNPSESTDPDLKVLAEMLEQVKTNPEKVWLRVDELHRILDRSLRGLVDNRVTPTQANRTSRAVGKVQKELNAWVKGGGRVPE